VPCDAVATGADLLTVVALGTPLAQLVSSNSPHVPTSTDLTALMAGPLADDGALNLAAPRRAIAAAVIRGSYLAGGGWPLPGPHKGSLSNGATRRVRRHVLSQVSFTRHTPEATRSDEERNILSCLHFARLSLVNAPAARCSATGSTSFAAATRLVGES
jgi:hypothetical protein